MVVNYKVLGFVAGAVIAAAAVFTFNTWRHVSDDDRLETVLRDHCIPYALSGTKPFKNLGRAPGVYDNVELRDGVEQGGAALIYDNRFVATWGIFDGIRFCDVKPTFGSGTVAAFEVEPDGFVDRTTTLLAEFEPLEPELDAVTDGPRTLGWFGIDRAQDEGLRVLMVVSPGLVSSVIAVTNLID